MSQSRKNNFNEFMTKSAEDILFDRTREVPRL